MRKLVLACGFLSALFLVFHIAFWWLLDWPSTLGYMTAEHRMLMQTFNLCILPIFAFTAYACLFLRDEVLSTRIGRAALAMNADLYLLRALAELLFGNLRMGQSQFFFVLALVAGFLFVLPLRRPLRPVAD